MKNCSEYAMTDAQRISIELKLGTNEEEGITQQIITLFSMLGDF